VAHPENDSQRDTLDLEKTEEIDTNDLKIDRSNDRSEEVTADLDANPVRKRFDSSQWITSW
jgi:hypothetical protein